MAEQTFKSPGFFEREIDLSERQQQPFGIPAAVIAPALRGPAFVPVTVGTFSDFVTKFGGLDPDRFGPYAVNEFLRHKTAVTYVRVLGAGANATATDISTTDSFGTVKNAGFKVLGEISDGGLDTQEFDGAVTLLCAEHDVTARSDIGMPIFADNDSFDNSTASKVVRGVVFVASGSRLLTLRANPTSHTELLGGDVAATWPLADSTFKLVVSSSAGASFASDAGLAGVKIYDVSLNPTSGSYIGKVLNTDPSKFAEEKHLLYTHFPIDDEVASITAGSTTNRTIAVLTGSAGSSSHGDNTINFRSLFGRFDTRYTTPKTPKFISQPFGGQEFDLFTIESLDDGEFANTRYKISITNVRKSTDERSDYGTFSVQVRDFRDTDTTSRVLEQFDKCTLDPDSEDFIGKKIGDKKARFNHDAPEAERRVIVEGQYPNKSKFIRVVLEESVKDKEVPATSLPFGFRGLEVLKTNQRGTDSDTLGADRLQSATTNGLIAGLTGSILPPIPFRTKVTRGQQPTAAPGQTGYHSKNEVVNQDLYWGVKTERNTDPLNPNTTIEHNELIDNMTKFMGIKKLDALYTGSVADTFNNNKFTLSRVVLGHTTHTELTASARAIMRDAYYKRNGVVDSKDYTVAIDSENRVTLATLVSLSGSVKFNKFSNFAKFTTIMHGGFDGLNILDKNASKLNDKSTSTDSGGGASSAFISPGLATNVAGTKLNNNGVSSYRTAIDLLSSEFVSNHNILAVPGQREPLVSDHSAEKSKEYGKALALIDLPQYDSSGNRLFDDRKVKPDVEKTIDALDSRGFDNNYAAAYFPDVEIDDAENTRRVRVPASVPALAALAFNDKVAFPWFAPAGFNRAALGFVRNVDVRLSAPDRDDLYDARINPIATFPRTGFVIFGQKTMQQAKSALDRVNVRRLLNECKRIVGDIAQEILFEPNTPATRQRFVSQAVLQLGIIQAQAGLENFKVVMDASNNTQKDIEENRLNGTIVVVPTRTVEFIAIDFIITSAGVEFV